jgi:transketolase
MTLYDIHTAFQCALARAEEWAEAHEGEISEHIAKELDAIEMLRDEKLGNSARLYKNLAAEVEMVKAEENRLKDRRRTLETRAAKLKEWIAQFMQVGETYMDGAVKLSWRPSEETIIDNEAAVPEAYCTYTRKVSASMLKPAIKADPELFAGVARVVKKQNLQIK